MELLAGEFQAHDNGPALPSGIHCAIFHSFIQTPRVSMKEEAAEKK